MKTFALALWIAASFAMMLVAQDNPQLKMAPNNVTTRTAENTVQVPKLTEVQQLKAEIQQLKEQLLQTQAADAQCRASLADVTARLDGATLTAQSRALQESRKALDADIRKALGAKEDDEVDWSTTPPSLKTHQK